MFACKLPAAVPSQIQHLQNTTTIGYTAAETSPDPSTGALRCQVCQFLLSQDEAPTLTCNRKWVVPCSSIDIKSAASVPLVPSPSTSAVSSPSPSVTFSSALSVTTSSSETSSPFSATPSTSPSSPEPVSQGETPDGGQPFLDRTVEVLGLRISTGVLISVCASFLVIIIMVILLVFCRRRRRRAEQRSLSKGKGLLDPEKGGYSQDDDGDDDNDGHPHSYGYSHESSSFSYMTEPRPKTDLYPSHQMSKSATSSFTPRHQHHHRSSSRSPDQPRSTGEHLPIASKHLSLDGSQAGSRHNSTSMISSSMTLSSSSSSSLVPSPPSSTVHQIPPIRQDALLSSISLSPIPYVPKSTFTPRSHPHLETAISMVSTSRPSESGFIELIPVEETPRLAHTALVPQIHEVQEGMVAEVVVPVVEEVSERVLEREQDGGSQETLVETFLPVGNKADAQIQTDSSTGEPWPSTETDAMTKRQLRKQRRRANRQAARARRDSAAFKGFLARNDSISSCSKVDQGPDENESGDDRDNDTLNKNVQPSLMEIAELLKTCHGFRARKSIRRARWLKSHARQEAEGKCLGYQRGYRVPPWKWGGKQRARGLHEGDGAGIVYGSYDAVDEHVVKALTTSLSILESQGEGDVVL